MIFFKSLTHQVNVTIKKSRKKYINLKVSSHNKQNIEKKIKNTKK